MNDEKVKWIMQYLINVRYPRMEQQLIDQLADFLIEEITVYTKVELNSLLNDLLNKSIASG